MPSLPGVKDCPLADPVKLLDLRDAVERFARRGGHNDPPNFFGDLAEELSRKNEISHDGYVSQGNRHVFWLAHQRLKDFYRRRASRPPLKYVHQHEIDAYVGNSRPDVGLARHDQPLAEFLRAFRGISPRDREILERKFLLGQSNSEIAAVIGGISADGIRSLIYRLRRRLRTATELVPPGDNRPSTQSRSV
jgi:RNA polymerase sigma factor (sigma-70 family)